MMTKNKNTQLVRAVSKSVSAPKKLKSLIALADENVDLKNQPHKIRNRTLLSLGLGAGLVATFANSLTAYPLFFFAGIFILPFGLTFLGFDILVPSVRRRKTPKRAAHCFLKAIRHRRWKNAYACIQPSLFTEEVFLPKLLVLEVLPESVDYKTLKGFKKYWKTILGSRSPHRRCTKTWFEIVDKHDETATAQCIVYVRLVQSDETTRIPLELRLGLYKHKSQWWVVPGEPKEIRDAMKHSESGSAFDFFDAISD